MRRLATPLLLASSLLLSVAGASAQTTFRIGVRGGLNRALTTLDAASNGTDGLDKISTNKSAIYTSQAGVVGEVTFGKLGLQPALVFSQKGEKMYNTASARDSGFPFNTERTSTSRYNWLEMPVNLVYTMQVDHGLQLFAGPYVAVAVGGRRTGTTLQSSSTVRYEPYILDEQIAYREYSNNRRFDAGVNFGIGYRQGPLQVQLGYGLGLRNLHQPGAEVYAGFDYHNFDADAAYNRVAQLTGTYFFSL